MGKLLILSVTNGEEQILDRIKEFLAEDPGIEVMEPPAMKHTFTFPGLELHLRKQTVKWQGQPLHLTHLEFFTLAYLARHPGWIFTMALVPGGLRRSRGQYHQPAPPEDGTGKPDPYRPPQRLQVRAASCNLRSLSRKNAVTLKGNCVFCAGRYKIKTAL